MNFQVIRPNGSQMKAIVHITLARILKATLVLKGLVIEWVIVKGCNEGGSTDSETDLWQESDYQVFRKITDNANAAMLNFSSPMYPEYGLKSFIVSDQLLFQRKKEKKSVIYFLLSSGSLAELNSSTTVSPRIYRKVKITWQPQCSIGNEVLAFLKSWRWPRSLIISVPLKNINSFFTRVLTKKEVRWMNPKWITSV